MKYLNLIKITFLNLTLFNLIGCINNNKSYDLNYLNGYWRIDYVTQNNEIFDIKDENILLDYYYLNSNKGWKKKVRPLLNKRFETSADTIFLNVKYDENETSLHLNSKWDNWVETIVSLDSTSLVLKIENRSYYYNKINPLLDE